MNRSISATRKTFALIGALLATAAAFAQNTMQAGSMAGTSMSAQMGSPSMDPASPDPASNAFSLFAQEWRSAKEAMMLSTAQGEKLITVLKAASLRLSENWDSIANYRKLAATASGETLARYKKRIQIAFGERDMIVTETESELRSFLTDDQTNIVLTAAFHGVSPSHSGSMASMPMGGMSAMATMGDTEMRVGEFAEKLNADSRAVSIDRIIDDLLSR